MPTLVQTAARVEGGYPSASISFSTTPTVGNLLIAYINFGPNYGGTITGATVTDNQGNTWQTAVVSILNAGAGAISYCVPTTASGTFTVTAQPTVSGTSDAAVGVAMQEWSGMSATPFDRSGTSNAISGSPYSATASGANATADSLVCAILTARSTITAIDNSPPSTGYTNVFSSLTSGSTEPAIASYKVVTSSETSSATWGVVTNGSDGTTAIATFSAAGGGGATLTVPLLTNTSTLYAPTVTRGAVAVAPPLLTNTSTLYAPTVAPGGATVEPPLLTNTSTLYAPTVSPGAVTVAPPILTNTSVLYAPTVAGGVVTITVPLLTNTNTLYEPTVVVGGVLELPLLTNTSTLYAPTVLSLLQILSLPLLTNNSTLYAPEVTGGLEQLSLPLLTNTSVLFAPLVDRFGTTWVPVATGDAVVWTPVDASTSSVWSTVRTR